MIYRPDLQNLQSNRKELKNKLKVSTGHSINVKTKNTSSIIIAKLHIPNIYKYR